MGARWGSFPSSSLEIRAQHMLASALGEETSGAVSRASVTSLVFLPDVVIQWQWGIPATCLAMLSHISVTST